MSDDYITVHQLLNKTYQADSESLLTSINPGAPQALALSATGANTYATVITPSEDKSHLSVSNGGSNPDALGSRQEYTK